ncbi:tetraacyldisaccharide 4'-kinase [Thalassotalea ganghwensis]
MRLIEKVWFQRHPAQWLLIPLLLPLTALFYLLTLARRWLYNNKFKRVIKCEVPVVVIGNIGVGGNGKTPLTIYLIEKLSALGIKVGVISRGYGGSAPHYPYLVNEQSTALEAGDEPILIYKRTGACVAVGADRIASVKLLTEQGCQLVLADDGLQHYRLHRDLEVVVVDAKRKFGNGLLLPAGPLREGQWRLATANYVVLNGQGELSTTHQPKIKRPLLKMSLNGYSVTNLVSGETLPIAAFIKQHSKVNAIAGIGDPQRFFDTLSKLGFIIEQKKGFTDHQAFTLAQLSDFSEQTPLLMTEKDAVKCQRFALENWWYIPVDASFEHNGGADLVDDIALLVDQDTLQREK